MAYKTEETLLYVKDLSVGYKDKNGNMKMILKDINIIEKNVVREAKDSTGQVIAFIGRSGRGKSTLFKALTGLLKPSTGEILINDIEFNKHKPLDAEDSAKILSEGDVGFVDQKYTLFRHKTIMEICEYAVEKFKKAFMNEKEGRSNADWKLYKDATIAEFLNGWGLMEHKDKYSCELSGGQRQRTAIIEQMLSNKHFMILDEPFSGLDVGNIEKVKQSFQRIGEAHEFNTIIFSTHDIQLAVELADSIYIIGFPEGIDDYSTIVQHYDLKSMGLAWRDYSDGHRELVTEIKELLLRS